MGQLTRGAAVAPGHVDEGASGRLLSAPRADTLALGLVLTGVLAVLGAGGIFHASIPAASDLPGHLLPQATLWEELLPGGSLRGWSHAWYGGFPVYYFYFPVPGLAAAALGALTTPAIALRLVTAVGVLALPVALWSFGRMLALRSVTTAWLVAVGGSFLFTQSYTILGGNLASAAAGEFSYAWSLALLVFHLAFLFRASPGRLDGLLAGCCLCAAGLSHVLPPIAVGLGTLPLLAGPRRRTILTSWGVAGGLSAFWLLPMAVRLDQTGTVEWAWTPLRRDLLPLEVVFLLPAAAFGWWTHRDRPGVAALALTAIAGLAVVAVPHSLFMPGRLLPIWFLGVHALAGIGIGAALSRAASGAWAVAAVTLGIAPWTAVLGMRGFSELVTFERGVFTGLDAAPEAGARDALVEELARLPSGRVYWEEDERVVQLGGPHALALLPLWTGHTTVQGLWGESAPLHTSLARLKGLAASDPLKSQYRDAATVPFDADRAVTALRALGARYVIAFSEPLKRGLSALPDARPLATRQGITVYDLGGGALVAPVPCIEPTGLDGRAFMAAGSTWLTSGDHAGGWPVSSAPVSVTIRCQAGEAEAPPPAVSDVVVDRGRVSFHTSAVGVPHLVKVSYFPNWRATGATQPVLAAPWFMMVVPSAPEVTLEFASTWVEPVAWLVTVVTVLTVLAAAWRLRASREADA